MKNILFVTEQGVVKRCEKSAFTNIRNNGIKAINLHDNDALKWVKLTDDTHKVVIITRNGQAVVFNEEDVRVMGRGASGVRGIRLKSDDIVVMADTTNDENAQILTITENGFAKRTDISEYRETSRGASGVKTHNVSEKTGKIISAKVINDIEKDIICMTKNGIVIRVKISAISKLGRTTGGVKIIKLDGDDKVVSAELVSNDEDQEGVQVEGDLE